MRRLLLPFALLLAVPASAQDWRTAPEYDVQLSAYDIQPDELRLKAGEPVRLRFVNSSNQALTFSADGFFRAAQMRRRDKDVVKGGAVQVPALSTRTVVVVPKAGKYDMRGANLLHRLLGMKGRIVVE